MKHGGDEGLVIMLLLTVNLTVAFFHSPVAPIE